MDPTDFVATLVYQDNGSRHLEEHRYRASHPELAWRLAMADGDAGRYGRNFVGLATLEATDEADPSVVVEEGDGAALVVEKPSLAAFNDPRWARVACDEGELARFSAAPPRPIGLIGIDDIRWHELSHAYGPATSVPRNLVALASGERELRSDALQDLFASIVHQGSLYSATAAAVPFIVQLLGDARVPDRAAVSALLERMAESVIEAEGARRGWFARLFDGPLRDVDQYHRESTRAVRQALMAQRDNLRKLSSDADADVASAAATVLEQLAL